MPDGTEYPVGGGPLRGKIYNNFMLGIKSVYVRIVFFYFTKNYLN